MSSTQSFYESGLGDRLYDSSYYPAEIVEFLRGEQRIVDSIAGVIDLLVEVGCMDGRYLDWAMNYNKKYIGLDVVARYIEVGRQRIAQRGLSTETYQLLVGAAEEIPHFINLERLHVEANRCLLLFPFNSFGNMAEATQVISALRESQLPFLISSYQTTEHSTDCRWEYYARCGYKDIRMSSDEKGVCFSSSDGLQSIAYHPEYMHNVCNDHGLAVTAISFSTIGLAYITDNILSDLPHDELAHLMAVVQSTF